MNISESLITRKETSRTQDGQYESLCTRSLKAFVIFLFYIENGFVIDPGLFCLIPSPVLLCSPVVLKEIFVFSL